MARRLKLFWGNHGGTHKGMVLASSKKAAAAVARCSLYDFNNFWAEIGSDGCPYLYQIKRETLYTRPNNIFAWGEFDSWFEGDMRFKKCPAT